MSTSAPKKIRILVADDAASARLALVRDVFSSSPYEIVGEAIDGHEAVEKYLALKPDVMTLDVMMPKHNVVSALRQILAADPQALVIVSCMPGQESLRLDAIASGAVDFFVKPFIPGEVERVIQRVLQSSKNVSEQPIKT